jgi:tRNA dimethylallyltransferase
MSSLTDRISIVVLVGPTAVGKTAAAIAIAEQIGAEVLSCDSRYFYIGMDIGTAKPTPDEMRGVPHHLIDIATPDQIVTLGDYKKRVHHLIEEIDNRGKIPLIVGGTGQYIRALIEGWEVPAGGLDTRLRDWVTRLWENQGQPEAGRWLARLDPESYARIDLKNPRRVIRALEATLGTGIPFSAQRIKKDSPYRVLQIGLTLPRAELFERIDHRIEEMLLHGFKLEVQTLLDKGFDEGLPSMSAIGYAEMRNHLNGLLTLEEAITLIKRRTRNFVRKQSNWFKLTDPSIHWFPSNTDSIQRINQLIRSFMRGDYTV